MLSRLLILCGVLASGCTFDKAGPGFSSVWELGVPDAMEDLAVDLPWGDGSQEDSSWPDAGPAEVGALDHAVPDQTPPRDLPTPKDLTPSKDLPTPDVPQGQGTTCSNAGISFSSSIPPMICTKINIQVKAKAPFGWVLVSVRTAASPGSVNWKNQPKVTKCGQHTCWDFTGVQVPCASGPYTFYFMKDATNDDPKKGTVVAVCTP